MNDEEAKRLERVETHLTHLERQYEELNQVVIEQAKILKRIQANQERLASSVQTSELERIKSTNPKPPHYG
jgi:uncharacterized coiled-coil protein SlyX